MPGAARSPGAPPSSSMPPPAPPLSVLRASARAQPVAAQPAAHSLKSGSRSPADAAVGRGARAPVTRSAIATASARERMGGRTARRCTPRAARCTRRAWCGEQRVLRCEQSHSPISDGTRASLRRCAANARAVLCLRHEEQTHHVLVVASALVAAALGRGKGNGRGCGRRWGHLGRERLHGRVRWRARSNVALRARAPARVRQLPGGL